MPSTKPFRLNISFLKFSFAKTFSRYARLSNGSPRIVPFGMPLGFQHQWQKQRLLGAHRDPIMRPIVRADSEIGHRRGTVVAFQVMMLPKKTSFARMSGRIVSTPDVIPHTTNAREQAALLVAQWLERKGYADQFLANVIENRPFVTELVYGVIRWQRTLRRLLRRYAHRQPDARTEAALLIGLYQLFFLVDVADYAAVHETVEAAKRIAGKRAAGFVNAVLRGAQSEGRAEIRHWLETLSPPVRWSHPTILYDRWQARFGADAAARLCEWNNTRPDVMLRINHARATAEALLAALAGEGIEARRYPPDPDRFLILPKGIAVATLPGYKEGWFYVQDPSTVVAPDLLAVQAGESVLDACAAPGGKTILLAEQLAGNGKLVAVDNQPTRLERLRDNLRRMGFDGVHVIQANAVHAAALRDALTREGLPWEYDAVLVDAPCTNTGVLRRRPDARWRFTPHRLETACFMQRAILLGAAEFVRSGGRLVYSTCSLEHEENEAQVEQFLAKRSDFALVTTRFLFPPDSQTDGAFAALLRRK